MCFVFCLRLLNLDGGHVGDSFTPLNQRYGKFAQYYSLQNLTWNLKMVKKVV